MPFVIPSIFTAVDKMTKPIEGISRTLSKFAVNAEYSGAIAERALRKIGDRAWEVSKATGAIALGILTPLVLATKKAIDFQDRLADVGKTTNMAGKELETFGRDIRKYSRITRTPWDELLTIGEIGGSLGVAKQQLDAFVKSADKFNIALGRDFSGGIKEAITAVAKLQNMYKELRNLSPAESINKTGSAINALNSKGIGTPQNITDFMLRTGALPDALKPSAQNAAALGAFFEKMAITSEIASSGFANLIITAGKNLPAFAKQMHITEQAARNLLATDPTEFVKKFSATFKGLAPDILAKKLTNLKLNSNEVIKVVGALASNTELLSKAQAISNKEFASGTSLAQEAATKNGTLLAKLEKAANILSDFAITIGESFLPALANLADKAGPVIERITNWIDKNRDLVATLAKVIAVVGGVMLAVSLISGAVTAFTKVWKVLSFVMTSGPLGWILLIIGLIVMAIIDLVSKTEGWGKQWDETMKWIGNVWNAFKSAIKLGCLTIANWFQNFVDTIYTAWVWLQNKMGMVSDAELARTKARIAEEQRLRLNAIQEAGKEYDKFSKAALAGPGWHVKMKEDTTQEREAILPSTVQNSAAIANSVQTINRNNNVNVEVSAAPGTKAKVSPTRALPVKTTGTVAAF